MPFTTSPNMGLTIPTVTQEPGPTYAVDINASLSLIDAHNHTPGQGVQIPSSGLNINADLSFAGNNAINLRSTRFSPQGSVLATPSDVGCVYLVGVDLYCNDGNGNNIRITQSGGLAGTNGSIANLTAPASATYVSINSTFVWQSAANVAATMDMRNAILRNSTAGSKGLTLSPPAAMAADSTITFPNIPGAQSFLTMDSSGNIAAPITYSAGITTANIAANTILASNVLSGQQLPLLTTTVSTNGSISANNALVLCNTGGGPITRQLYDASANSGYTVRIKKTTSDFNQVTLTTTGGASIDGASTSTVATQNEVLTLASDGTNWQILDRNYPESWASTTFTFSGGITSVGTQNSFSRRVGDSLEGRLDFNNLGVSAAQASIGLPSGLAIDISKISNNRTYCGIYNRQTNNGQYYPGSGAPANTGVIFVDTGAVSSLSMSFQAVASGGGPYNRFTMNSFFVSTDGISAEFKIPIVGWA